MPKIANAEKAKSVKHILLIRNNEAYCAFWNSGIWSLRAEKAARWEITRNRDQRIFVESRRLKLVLKMHLMTISEKIVSVNWKVKTRIKMNTMMLVLFAKGLVQSKWLIDIKSDIWSVHEDLTMNIWKESIPWSTLSKIWISNWRVWTIVQ